MNEEIKNLKECLDRMVNIAYAIEDELRDDFIYFYFSWEDEAKKAANKYAAMKDAVSYLEKAQEAMEKLLKGGEEIERVGESQTV